MGESVPVGVFGRKRTFPPVQPVRVPVHSTTPSRSKVIAIASVLSVALLHSTAQAQDSDEAPKQDQNHILLGLGAEDAPAYEGARKHRVLPLPALDVQWGSFFANLDNGIGINLIDSEFVTVGTSVMFMPGYRSEDAPKGIGTLSVGAGGRAFVSLHAAGLVATVGGTKGVAGGTKGTVADATLSYPIAMTARFRLTPSIATTWADAKHNNRYFGVDAQQSLASGLPQFAPGKGVKDASAQLSATYILSEHFVLGVSVGATTLLNKVKDSPIVFHKNAQPTGLVYIAYRFR
jgi:MipA family protein